MVNNNMKTLTKLTTAMLLLAAFIGAVSASPAELTIFPETSSTEVNSFTSYQVELENVGPTADVYTLASQSSEVTIAPRRVPETDVLEPGDSRTVNVWYNPGPQKDAGTFTFDITATSRATGQKYAAEGTVEVIKDHDVNVQIVDSQTACLNQEARYDVQVSNDGIQDETFDLVTRYGELSQKQVTLAPGETTNLTLVAPAGAQANERSFNVVAASTSSYAQDIESVQLVTEQCYASDVTIQPQQQETAAKTEAEYEVTVRNTGTREDNFVLSSNIGEFDDSQMEIEGGDSETTTLTVTPTTLGNKRVDVTAKSQVTSTASATLQVNNGMDATVAFEDDSQNICERESVALAAEIENTGAAEETFSLSSTFGQVSDEEITLEPGDDEDVEVEVNSSQIGQSATINLTATALSFGEPAVSDSTIVNVENCYDLKMTVVPEVASAGENRSVIYEIQLNNNGTQENTYELSYEGPEWINVQPEEITIPSGETQKAYIYAGIPFGKDTGQVEITAEAVGRQIERSQTVQLVIGDDIEDAIEDDSNNGPTGGFAQLPDIEVTSTNLGRIAASVIIGLLITAGVLYREW